MCLPPRLYAAAIAIRDTPRALSGSNWRFKGDLEAIALIALAKDREQRYGSAGELGDDLERFLAHQPLRARTPSAWSLMTRWIRRHRLVTAALAIAVASLIGGAAAAMCS